MTGCVLSHIFEKHWIENINAMLDGIKVSVRSIVLSDIRTNCFDDLSEPEEKCMNTITK